MFQYESNYVPINVKKFKEVLRQKKIEQLEIKLEFDEC